MCTKNLEIIITTPRLILLTDIYTSPSLGVQSSRLRGRGTSGRRESLDGGTRDPTGKDPGTRETPPTRSRWGRVGKDSGGRGRRGLGTLTPPDLTNPLGVPTTHPPVIERQRRQTSFLGGGLGRGSSHGGRRWDHRRHTCRQTRERVCTRVGQYLYTPGTHTKAHTDTLTPRSGGGPPLHPGI